MARRKAEIDLLGVASKEELVKFEVGKEVDKPLAETVAKINNKSGAQSNLVTEEELLRIRKKGEQEILDIQNELKEFKMNEERMISFLPIEDEEEEEEYIPTRFEKVVNRLKSPFIYMVDKFDDMNTGQKIDFLKSIIIILLVLLAMSLAIFSIKKYKIVYRDFVSIELMDTGAGKYAMPNFNMTIDGVDYKLTKVIVDGQNTVFTFDGPGDILAGREAYLIDTDGNKYYTDQHYMRNMRSTNQGKVIAFQPLLDGTQKFDFVISDIETGESVSYSFRFKKFLSKPDYIKLYNTESKKEEGLNINSFVATATGSVLNYTFVSKDDDYTYKIRNEQGMSSAIYEDLSIIPSKQNRIESYEFPKEKATLYQESFATPSDLNGTIEFKADNVFKSYPVDKTYTQSQLKAGAELDFGDYTLVVEGVQKRGDIAVLVYHVIDNEFKPEEPEQEIDYGAKVREEKELKESGVKEIENFYVSTNKLNETERVYAMLDADIVRVNGKGEVIDEIEPSRLNASNEGADLVFVDDRLKTVVGNYQIHINSIDIRDTAYHAYIDLSENGKDSQSDILFVDAIENIKEGFDSRLAYRAAEKSWNKITYFSDEIMNDKELMTRYVPLNLDRPASYSTEIINATESGKYVYAVVEEHFLGNVSGDIVNLSETHRVIYDMDKKEITRDDILENDEEYND